MKRQTGFLVLALCSIGLLGATSKKTNRLPKTDIPPVLTLQVEPGPPEAPTELRMSLHYEGAHTFKMREGLLPWGSSSDLILVPAQLDGEVEHIPPLVEPIDDPPWTMVTIHPGGTLTGKREISYTFEHVKGDRMEHLSDKLQQQDMLLFWSYSLEMDNGAHLPRIGGWVLLPRTKSP